MKNVLITMVDRSGGVPNVMRNMLRFRKRNDFRYEMLLFDEKNYGGNRVNELFNVDRIHRVSIDHRDSIFGIKTRIASLIETEFDLRVINTIPDLMVAAISKVPEPILFVVHGNDPLLYRQICHYETMIDSFVTVSQHICDQMVQLIPHRSDSIHHVSHPIPPATAQRKPNRNRKLRVIFVGRLVALKGTLLLPQIDSALCKSGCDCDWSIVGSGRDDSESKLKGDWTRDSVTWFGETNSEKLSELIAEHDVLILPSRSEGFPMVVPEAMKAGLVPVVSDLESGIPEIIKNGKTGFRCQLDDVSAFASSIHQLDRDRETLEQISEHAKEIAEKMFDPVAQSRVYESLFESTLQSKMEHIFPRLHRQRLLDRPFLPNPLVRAIRTIHRRKTTTSRS